METPILSRFSCLPVWFALVGGILFSNVSSRGQEKGRDLVIIRPVRVDSGDVSNRDGWEDLGGGLFKKLFCIPPTFIGTERTILDYADPFVSGNSGAPPKRRTAQEILSDRGIKFAEGTSAIYNPVNSHLLVVQTDDQIDAIELFLGEITPSPEKHINIRAEIFEVSEVQALQVVESVRTEGEHSPEREALMKAVVAGSIKLIAFPNVVCRSGQRAMVLDEIVSEVSQKSSRPEAGKDGTREEDHTVAMIKLEADAVLGADVTTIDLNFSLAFSEPLPAPDGDAEDFPHRHRRRSIITQTTLKAGDHRLVGTWSAPGKRVFLAFLSAHLQELPTTHE